jgi:hypothetical protein
MSSTIKRLLPALATAVLLTACAGDGGSMGGLFETASVAPTAIVPVATKADSTCVTLATQIDGLRKEGTIDRLEKVAAGRGENVQVKRTAIAKQAELNKANADFLAKCGPKIPASQQASVAPAAVAAVVPATAGKAAAKLAVPSGVTVAAPTAMPKVQ